MYEKGRGVKQSYETAVEYYRLGCDQKHGTGCTNLGYLTEMGLGGLRKSKKKALALYEEGCQRDSEIGCANLAWMYEKGYGTEQSYEEAARLYKKACEMVRRGLRQPRVSGGDGIRRSEEPLSSGPLLQEGLRHGQRQRVRQPRVHV